MYAYLKPRNTVGTMRWSKINEKIRTFRSPVYYVASHSKS